MYTRNLDSPSTKEAETVKEKFDSLLGKYGVLWKSLSSHPDVLREIGTFRKEYNKENLKPCQSKNTKEIIDVDNSHTDQGDTFSRSVDRNNTYDLNESSHRSCSESKTPLSTNSSRLSQASASSINDDSVIAFDLSALQIDDIDDSGTNDYTHTCDDTAVYSRAENSASQQNQIGMMTMDTKSRLRCSPSSNDNKDDIIAFDLSQLVLETLDDNNISKSLVNVRAKDQSDKGTYIDVISVDDTSSSECDVIDCIDHVDDSSVQIVCDRKYSRDHVTDESLLRTTCFHNDDHHRTSNDSSEEVEWSEDITPEDEITEDRASVSDREIILSDDDEVSYCTSVSHTEVDDKTNVQTKQVRLEFARKREVLAKQYFDEFNTKVFNNSLNGVELGWSSKLRTTAGYCKSGTRNNMKFAKVELSTKVITNVDRLQNTLLHELCHAAAWVVDGVTNPPHGSCFRKWAHKAMQRIEGITVTTTHTYNIEYKYAWACTTPNCNAVVKRHSRSFDVDRYRCSKCKGKFVEIEIPRGENSSHAVKKRRNLTGFSLFVQQHSREVRIDLKARLGTVSQSEVMKECSRLWSLRKLQESVSTETKGVVL